VDYKTLGFNKPEALGFTLFFGLVAWGFVDMRSSASDADVVCKKFSEAVDAYLPNDLSGAIDFIDDARNGYGSRSISLRQVYGSAAGDTIQADVGLSYSFSAYDLEPSLSKVMRHLKLGRPSVKSCSRNISFGRATIAISDLPKPTSDF